jgi:imidazolonepropionase-like amidohydrolase
MAPYTKSIWNPSKDFRFRNLTKESFSSLKEEYLLKLKVIKAMDRIGVPMIAGTDYPNPLCYPGFGIHDEMGFFVKAGLTPAHALQTATINAARYLDLQQQYGTVSGGKIADLVILDANPLTDISNTTKINTVIVHGKVYSRGALDNMMEAVKKMNGN